MFPLPFISKFILDVNYPNSSFGCYFGVNVKKLIFLDLPHPWLYLSDLRSAWKGDHPHPRYFTSIVIHNNIMENDLW